LILKRCPSCRTLCDAERDARCFACGGELSKDGPPARARVPEVLRTSRRDRKSSSALLIIFAVFGGFGVFFVAMSDTAEPLLRFGLGALLLAAVILGVWSSMTKGGAVGIVSKALLGILALIGLLIVLGIGLLILLFVACAAGLMR
jgi:hypothetical protein